MIGPLLGGGLLILMGFVVAIKTPLLVSIILLAFALVCMIYAGKDAELEGVIYFVIFILYGIGSVIGWLYYYVNFYPGSINFGWLFQP